MLSGTFLSDLTFIDEGNPNYVEVANLQGINFQKFSMIVRSIKKIMLYQVIFLYSNRLIFISQENRMRFPVKEPYYSFLKDLPMLQEKELYELSLQREPRNSLAKDLE